MIHFKHLLKQGFIPSYRTFKKGRKKICECSNIFTFDIETTSYWMIDGQVTSYKECYTTEQLNDAEKGSLCYIWQFSIDDKVYYGRNLEEFPILLEYLNSKLDPEALRYIYVHNLSFETQTLRNVLNIEAVFARTERKPMYIRANGFEFRCSYLLTHLSLETWGKELGCLKKVGDLDYNVLRTPLTTLSDAELGYCEQDCIVVYEGIKKFVKKYKTITQIPLTQTGEVRRVVKQKLKKDWVHHRIMQSLLPYNFEFYKTLKWLFAGGSTGTCYLNANEVIYDVWSYDKTSDYPFQLFQKQYPINGFRDITGLKESDNIDIEKNCYIYVVKFNGLTQRGNLSYLSTSRCRGIKGLENDNGKIKKCDWCVTCINEHDMKVMEMVYKWDSMDIIRLYRARKGYLNKTFLEYILELYGNKTKLKGLKDATSKELYMQSKQYINAGSFGMLVMDMMQSEITYKNDEWSTIPPTEQKYNELIEDLKENAYKNVFSYAQGCYITSLARLELWNALVYIDRNSENGSDVVYYDTDSCKFKNGNKHKEYFEAENLLMVEKLRQCANDLCIDFNLFNPTDSKGIVRTLGLWDNEDERDGTGSAYKEFKTQGAKRYAYKLYDDTIHLTVSGVPKACAIALSSLDDFNDDFVFDKDLKDEAGNYISKKLSQYMDKDNLQCTFPDGYKCNFKYGLVLRNNGYNLGLACDYLTLIMQGKEKGRI